MKIQVDFSAPLKTKWHEYAIRFLFGGAVTAIAGVIATKYGPVVGGLFLASPAIFPASATLVAKHESQKKQRSGLRGEVRAIEAAGVDANGAALGSIGLLAFGAVAWKLFPACGTWLVLLLSSSAWMAVSMFLWHLRKNDQMLFRHRRSPHVSKCTRE